MKYVKWLFVVTIISSLISFVDKDKATEGLSVGDIAPNFKIETMSLPTESKLIQLNTLRGKCVLLSFWASYDAQSRMENVSLNNVLRSARNKVVMVSISFDDYRSIFEETIHNDKIVASVCSLETEGAKSDVFKKYRLNRGFTNYLLDGNGKIIAKDISAVELSSYMNSIKI